MFKKIISSSKNLFKVYPLCVTSMMIALAVVVGMFSLLLSNYVRISFYGIILSVPSILFGPVMGGIAGFLTDLLKYIVRPQGIYSPGLALGEVMTCFIYGLFLYKRTFHSKAQKITNIILMQLIITVLIRIVINSFWLSSLYHTSYGFILAQRILPNIFMIPVDCILLYFTHYFTTNILARSARSSLF